MEALWHVAATHAPTGAIGALSNQDIADEMFWEDDADQLVGHLVAAEILDECAVHRLIVHDWHENADSYVHAWLAKRGMYFANGAEPKIPHDAFDFKTRERISAEYIKRKENSQESPGLSGNLPENSQESPGELPAIPFPVPVPEPVITPPPVNISPERDILTTSPSNGEVCKSPPKRAKSPPAGHEAIFELLPATHDTQRIRDAWANYEAVRRAKHWKPFTLIGLKEKAKLLARHPPDVAAEMIERSVANEWQGIFEPRGNSPPKDRVPRTMQQEFDEVMEVFRKRDEQQEKHEQIESSKKSIQGVPNGVSQDAGEGHEILRQRQA